MIGEKLSSEANLIAPDVVVSVLPASLRFCFSPQEEKTPIANSNPTKL